MLMNLAEGWHQIPFEFLREPNTSDLVERRDAIWKKISSARDFRHSRKGRKITEKEKASLMKEYSYLSDILTDRYIRVRLLSKEKGSEKMRVFISHSSKDKDFVRILATDISEMGYEIWLDEWQIRAGEVILKKVSDGLESSDLVVVVLSSNAVASTWVEREWHAKYGEEIQKNKIMVIPVLIDDCKTPHLLAGKKYADFRREYRLGLDELEESFALLARR